MPGSGESPGPRITLYDPCCGGASHLAALAYLHWSAIGQIVASDMDPDVLALAGRNLALLTAGGLERRTSELQTLLAQFGKESHRAALASAGALHARLLTHLESHAIATRLFRADATQSHALAAGLKGTRVDVVLADVPYGKHSHWQTTGSALLGNQGPIWHMLEALRPVIRPATVVAIAADKSQRPAHAAYTRLERFQIGRRQVTLLRLLPEDRPSDQGCGRP